MFYQSGVLEGKDMAKKGSSPGCAQRSDLDYWVNN